jgi:hypothetical protein
MEKITIWKCWFNKDKLPIAAGEWIWLETKQKEKRKTLTDLYSNDKGHEQKIQRTLNKVHGDPLYRPAQ